MNTITLEKYRETVAKLNDLYDVHWDVQWRVLENELKVSQFGRDTTKLEQAELILLEAGFKYNFRLLKEFDYISFRTITSFAFTLEKE